MLTLLPGAQIVTDPASGRGSLITPDTGVWTLNPTALVALTVLANGQPVARVEEELARRWPAVPLDQLRSDLDRLLADLEQGGAVRQVRHQ
ncbi:PqqD family protein [Streptomyces sp. AC563]|uniref:PqqD family protein n=1 Tax=Streptomyces buecherae TaxID=2763006 RepID=UPI00164EBEE7|nr:PqqD family protein [Streptomyces buecherae]MBC3990417.1 PqqD family protein [Streptomyces buecherae]